MPLDKNQITQILHEVSQGNRTKINLLIPLVYDELHKAAEKQLFNDRMKYTLNATALAHEAYIKMVNQDSVRWNDRSHFFALSAQAMRRILIDYARSKKALKRGAEKITLTFNEEQVVQEVQADELLALHEALDRLSTLNNRQGQVIEYWFFGGLTHKEIADVLGVSVPSVRRDWRLARAWLSRELKNTF